LWFDDDAGKVFADLHDVESWMNKRLSLVKQPNISFEGPVLTMRHMDLVRRNILLLSNHSIALVDCEFSGIFPRLFELWTLRHLVSNDKESFTSLLETVGCKDEHDEHDEHNPHVHGRCPQHRGQQEYRPEKLERIDN
jgi:thiamine kinase-like enzyme